MKSSPHSPKLGHHPVRLVSGGCGKDVYDAFGPEYVETRMGGSKRWGESRRDNG